MGKREEMNIDSEDRDEWGKLIEKMEMNSKGGEEEVEINRGKGDMNGGN